MSEWVILDGDEVDSDNCPHDKGREWAFNGGHPVALCVVCRIILGPWIK